MPYYSRPQIQDDTTEQFFKQKKELIEVWQINESGGNTTNIESDRERVKYKIFI